MRAKDALGRYGEEVAAAHLRDAGLRVIDRNWRCADGEIDIVAVDGDALVFCEVKTRSSLRYGAPAEAVVGPKAARLRRLAAQWLAARPEGWETVRFDVVSVLWQPRGAAQVQHLVDAF